MNLAQCGKLSKCKKNCVSHKIFLFIYFSNIKISNEKSPIIKKICGNGKQIGTRDQPKQKRRLVLHLALEEGVIAGIGVDDQTCSTWSPPLGAPHRATRPIGPIISSRDLPNPKAT